MGCDSPPGARRGGPHRNHLTAKPTFMGLLQQRPVQYMAQGRPMDTQAGDLIAQVTVGHVHDGPTFDGTAV